MTDTTDHDGYIAAAPAQFRPVLETLRAQLSEALPDAEEVVQYGMPGFRIGRTIVAAYAAFSKQCGLYLSASALTAHADDIAAAGLKATKTGITFRVDDPPSAELVERLAHASRRDAGL
ncbi:iron chaperone [Microbacterium hominis]|uniref:DUF1801 domain-containing protein n=1 Tax=Microbacterium hominis TaxID=162426 RepID=A0A7D4TEL0_9MICO|nr:DUF1801 domain-containing protein [Microbacterium hominis]QKJ18021.1 DUF1801 domain-containing protein [Microbacterium hominis]